MSTQSNPWRPSAVLLAISGLLMVSVGMFFILLRPALLPEDVRYMGLGPGKLELRGPAFQTWLARVFTVLGGFAVASGVLAAGLAATSFRTRSHIALLAAAAGGFSSIGLMSAVNMMIDSDFKWPLLGKAAIWCTSIGCYLVEGISAKRALR